MVRSTRSVYIDAPVEAVFGFTVDVSNWGLIAPSWLHITYEPVDVDVAADGIGAVAWAGTLVGGVGEQGRGAITEVVENRRIVYRDDDPSEGTKTFLFERLGEGTVLIVVDEREEGRIERIPLIGKIVEWVADQHDVQWNVVGAGHCPRSPAGSDRSRRIRLKPTGCDAELRVTRAVSRSLCRAVSRW